MLVLGRKLDEEIWIEYEEDKFIKIKIVGIRNGNIKIGIDAPKGFAIYRKEILGAYKDKKQS